MAMKRIEIGPLLVALAALMLLVSLFLEWFGDQTAWDAFELADLLLAALAVAALVASAGLLIPSIDYLDRRWIPVVAIAAALVIAALLLSPPAQVGDADPRTGAWLAFGATMLMLVGALLSVGRVSFSVAVEGRDPRRRVAAVDHRPPPTDTGPIVPRPRRREQSTAATEPVAVREPVAGEERER
jgi:hypothetical protein